MMNGFIVTMFFSVLCLCLVRNHVFLCLVSLEFVVVVLLVIIFYCLMFSVNLVYVYIVFMTFFVCEGALGLSLIILMVRVNSNDYLNSMVLW